MNSTSLQTIVQWVNGQLFFGGETDSGVSIKQVCTDTRQIDVGDLFVALKGENFDAHTFVEQGKAGVAAAVIVERHCEGLTCPQIIVQDSRLALGDLARAYRQDFKGKVFGITGSNGKTTVKEMIAAICKIKGETLATIGNLNNDIGLPQTLFNVHQQAYAVIEMGANHHGEISYLTNIATPDIAVITHAGSAHLEGFGDIPGVAKAKGEIYEGLSESGIAVINADDSHNAVWFDKAGAHKVITFGLQNKADFSADWKAAETGNQIDMVSCIEGNIETTKISMNLFGVHNVMNALAAAAASSAAGIDLTTIKQGLEDMQSVKGRLQWSSGPQGMRVLDDTYNANPTSLGAGLAVLATVPGEHWLILGDMGELGTKSEEMHEEAGRLARRAGVSRMLTFGTLSRVGSEFFGEGGEHFTDQQALLNTVNNEWKGEGAVLVKGSRNMKMEQFVDALKQQAVEQAAEGEY